jgi:formiminotetrahydrofolate cyclodeaminase
VAAESVGDFLDRLASGAPTPGGGAAAALTASSAAALVAMVCRVTLKRSPSPELTAAATEADDLRRRLWDLAACDAAAFEQVIAARRRPEPERAAAVAAAMREATAVPVDIAAASARVVELCEAMNDEARATALGDLAVAVLLAAAALEAAVVTARVNLAENPDPGFVKTLDDARRRAEGARARLGGRRRT